MAAVEKKYWIQRPYDKSQTVKAHSTTEGISPYHPNDTGHCVISQATMNAVFSITIIILDCTFVGLFIWLLFFQAA